MRTVKNGTLALVAVALGMTLVGCGGGGSSDVLPIVVPTPTVAPTPTAAPTPTPEPEYTAYPYDAPAIEEQDKQAYLDAVNEARSVEQDCGTEGIMPPVGALLWSDELYSAAYEHSEDMVANNYVGHDGSGTDSDWTAQVQELGRGSTVSERGKNSGFGKYVGENCTAGHTARDSVEKAVQGLLDSDKHCENMMDSRYTHLGMARVISEDSSTKYENYWTQLLGIKY